MPRPSGAEAPEEEPLRLPAPYAPPWRRLGEDLLATLAWLQLRARELLRRNGEGTLPLPPFWPRRWPQLFWPVLLVAVLLGAGALGWALWGAAKGTAGPLPGAGEVQSAPAQEPRVSPPPSPQEVERGDGDQEEPALRSEVPGEEANPEPFTGSPTVPEGETALETAPAVPEEISAAERLLAEWSADDPERFVEAIHADPSTATLTLQLRESFPVLPLRSRMEWAERWQGRAAELGYAHLQLQDGQQRLLGRDARVGSGMILLAPP